MGFSSISGDETIMHADNASFDSTSRGGKMTTNGQLWIGSTVAPHVKLGTLTSTGGTIAITPGAGFINLDLTGGGGATEHLTADTGGLLNPDGSNNFNIIGQQAGTVAVVDTIGSVSTIKVEDRTWQTQYVVDASSTAGLKGTFTTIQAAINQAVTDGMLYTAPRKIYIRTGTYTENLSIPGGTMLVGETFAMPTQGAITPTPTVISGHHTLSGTVTCAFNNITFNNIGGSTDMFSSGALDLCYFNNCLLQSTSSGNFINNSVSGSTYKFTNCSFANTGDQTYFTSNQSSSSLYFDNCFYTQPAGFAWQGSINFAYCRGIGPVTLSASSSIYAYFSTFISSISGYQISGSGTAGSIIGCLFSSIPALANTVTSSIRFSNNAYGDLNNSNRFYQNGAVYNAGQSQQGSIVKSVKKAVGYTLSPFDYYVGVTSTAAPRTMVLPDGSDSVCQDQVFIIKDESGAAGTNNITVQGTTALIDGAASFVINNNYGSLTVKYDGTNYFII